MAELAAVFIKVPPITMPSFAYVAQPHIYTIKKLVENYTHITTLHNRESYYQW